MNGCIVKSIRMIKMAGIVIPGRLLNIVKFENTGTFTPSAETVSIVVEACGGGGAGGSAGAITSAGNSFIGGGGQAGAYAKSWFLLADIPNKNEIAIVIGAGAISVPVEPGNSQNVKGGTTSFGDLINCEGGNGAFSWLCTVYPYIIGNSSVKNSASGGNILNFGGSDGNDFFALSSSIASSGVGACNPLSSSVLNRITIGVGASATTEDNGYGAGGAGALSQGVTSQTFLGGSGSQGVVIIYEYS